MDKRSVLNVGIVSGSEYRFINHIHAADQWGPTGTQWIAGAVYPQALGANGYPNVSLSVADAKLFGGAIRIPASWVYGAPSSGQFYVLRWRGNGQVRLATGLSGSSWTLQSGMSTNATSASSDSWKTSSGSDTYVVVNFTGPAQMIFVYVQSTDTNNVGAFLNSLAFYRLDDEADYLAGKIFRRPYKQSVVDYNPSVLRFVDWVGGNNAKQTWFSTRTLPNYPSWGAGVGTNWVASPAYGETSGVNQLTLAASVGTTGNSKTTPTSMIHGEIVTCRIGAGLARCGLKTVSAITKANPGVVTSTAHGFSDGDIIAHNISTGMTQLHLVPVTITVIDADNYSIGIDTSSFTTFTAGTSEQFTTLNVGGRGDYPIVFPSVNAYGGRYGNGYISAGDYKTFIFDKSVAYQRDTAGDYIYGVWMFNDLGANNGHNGGVPLEICTALVNEVNQMSTAPIGMYLNIPHLGMSSMDPDYNLAENWGVNAVNVILNGANGFSGLTSAAPLLLEYSNETWNSGGNGTSQTPYCALRGYLRWPASGTGNFSAMHSLRSVIAMTDILNSAYFQSRVKFVMAGQGTRGASDAFTTQRIDGSNYYLNDPLITENPQLKGQAPITFHDYFAFAGYFEPTTTYDTANLATITAQWVADIGNDAAQEADCASYITNGIVSPSTGETTNRYGNTLLPGYVTKLAGYGKSVIMYEGGWNHACSAITASSYVSGSAPFCPAVLDGSTNVITGLPSAYVSAVSVGDFVYGYGISQNTTVVSKPDSTSLQLSKNTTSALAIGQIFCMTPTNAFLRACKKSRTWASTMISYFRKFDQYSNAGMPSDYVEMDSRWGHIYPSAYGTKNTEYSDLDETWIVQGLRNKGKRRLYW